MLGCVRLVGGFVNNSQTAVFVLVVVKRDELPPDPCPRAGEPEAKIVGVAQDEAVTAGIVDVLVTEVALADAAMGRLQNMAAVEVGVVVAGEVAV